MPTGTKTHKLAMNRTLLEADNDDSNSGGSSVSSGEFEPLVAISYPYFVNANATYNTSAKVLSATASLFWFSAQSFPASQGHAA